jgi:cytochrome c-type biogenesis protein CcmH
MRARAVLLALILALPNGAGAVEPREILSDPVLEARARAVSAELRCLVCQNESIDDSRADLAKDLRLIVRERLTAGDSDEQVRAYLVARYGDFILLKPPFKIETWLLWLTPLVALGLGGWAMAAAARRGPRDAPAAPAPLTTEEQARLAEALKRPQAS